MAFGARRSRPRHRGSDGVSVAGRCTRRSRIRPGCRSWHAPSGLQRRSPPRQPRLCQGRFGRTQRTTARQQAEEHLSRLLRNFRGARPRGHSALQAPATNSPCAVGKQAELRLLRHQDHRGGGVSPGNPAFPLRLCPRLPWLGWFDLPGRRRRQLRKCLAHAWPGCDRCRGRCRRIDFRDLYSGDGWSAGIEHHALRPFPVGADPNHRHLGRGTFPHWQFRQIGV
jgi:hypothetical protein